MGENLDIIICGSSRPELLPYCVESVRRFIISQAQSTKCRIIVHEDFVNENKSQKVVNWCRENGIDKILTHNPCIGYGKALYGVMNNNVKAKYVLNLQDDWEFERTGIDIDRVIWTMERHNIWSIIFNKKGNNQYKGDHFKKEFDFDGMKLVLADSWRVTPSVWNTEVARKHIPEEDNPAGKIIRSFGGSNKRKDMQFSKNNVRSYLYGGLREPRWVRHLGNTWIKRKNRKKKKGCSEWDIVSLKDRPPWIPFYNRPMNIHWCEGSDSKVRKMLKNFPKEIRKEFEK